MLTKTKIALSLAMIFATAPAALAATKHPVRHSGTAVEQGVPGGLAYGSARHTGRVAEDYIAIQDEGMRQYQ